MNHKSKGEATVYRYSLTYHPSRRRWQRTAYRTRARVTAGFDSTRLREAWRRLAELFDLVQWEMWKLARLLASLLNPLRNPCMVVAGVLTVLAEMGAPTTWTQLLFTFLANLTGLQVVTWLIGEVAISAMVTVEEWWRRLARREAQAQALFTRPQRRPPPPPLFERGLFTGRGSTRWDY
jgi:hypothetical protein